MVQLCPLRQLHLEQLGKRMLNRHHSSPQARFELNRPHSSSVTSFKGEFYFGEKIEDYKYRSRNITM